MADQKIPSWALELDEEEAKNNSVATTAKDFLTNLAQGASMGFGDEILGAGKTLINDKSYKQNRDDVRRALAESQERSPIASKAGDIAGGFASGALIPGGALTKSLQAFPKIAQLVSKSPKAAAYISRILGAGGSGAVTGLGYSEGDLGQNLADTATGALTSGALGAGFKATGDVASKAYNLSKGAIKGGAKMVSGLTDDQISGLMTKPIDKLKKGVSLEDVGQSAIKLRAKLDDDLLKASQNADALLKQDKSIERTVFDDVLTGVKDKLGVKTKIDPDGNSTDYFKSKETESGFNYLKDRVDYLKKYFNDGDLSEADLKDAMKSLRQNINFNADSDGKAKLEALKTAQGILDDKLKTINTGYKEAMKPVANLMYAKTKLDKKLKFNELEGEFDDELGFKPSEYDVTDSTMSTLKNALGEGKGDAVKALKEAGGSDVVEDLEVRKLLDDTKSPTGASALDRGSVIKSGVNYVSGKRKELSRDALIKARDKGWIADKVKDTVNKYENNPNKILEKAQGTSFFGGLKNAFNRGSKPLAVQHFILMQTNPEYQKLHQEE